MSIHFKIVNETGRWHDTKIIDIETGLPLELPLRSISWQAKVEEITTAEVEVETMPGLDVSAEAIVVFLDAVVEELNFNVLRNKEQEEMIKEELWQGFLRHHLAQQRIEHKDPN